MLILIIKTGTFLQLLIKLLAALNTPVSTISNGDRQPSSRLSDSRSVIQFVSQKDVQTSVSQIASDADSQPASVSACVQCISSLSITESSPTMLNHINWPGSNATAVVLNISENKKILNIICI